MTRPFLSPQKKNWPTGQRYLLPSVFLSAVQGEVSVPAAASVVSIPWGYPSGSSGCHDYGRGGYSEQVSWREIFSEDGSDT